MTSASRHWRSRSACGASRLSTLRSSNALTIPLKDIDQVLGDITFKELLGRKVHYDMTVGQESGLVVFVLDRDGIWRLEFV
jgi:hypothetical protein